MKTETQVALVQTLRLTPQESKKYQMVKSGMTISGIVFLLTSIAMVFKPELSEQFMALAKALLTVIGGLTGVYTGSQAWVENGTVKALGNTTDG